MGTTTSAARSAAGRRRRPRARGLGAQRLGPGPRDQAPSPRPGAPGQGPKAWARSSSPWPRAPVPAFLFPSLARCPRGVWGAGAPRKASLQEFCSARMPGAILQRTLLPKLMAAFHFQLKCKGSGGARPGAPGPGPRAPGPGPGPGIAVTRRSKIPELIGFGSWPLHARLPKLPIWGQKWAHTHFRATNGSD